MSKNGVVIVATTSLLTERDATAADLHAIVNNSSSSSSWDRFVCHWPPLSPPVRPFDDVFSVGIGSVGRFGGRGLFLFCFCTHLGKRRETEGSATVGPLYRPTNRTEGRSFKPIMPFHNECGRYRTPVTLQYGDEGREMRQRRYLARVGQSGNEIGRLGTCCRGRCRAARCSRRGRAAS